MPASEKSSRAFATGSSSRNKPIASKNGTTWLKLRVGLALCATTQIEQVAESIRLAWLWVDSAAAAHNISDRQNHADHRTHARTGSCTMLSCFGIRLLKLITVIQPKAIAGTLL